MISLNVLVCYFGEIHVRVSQYRLLSTTDLRKEGGARSSSLLRLYRVREDPWYK